MNAFSYNAAINCKHKRNWNKQIKKGGKSDNVNYRSKTSMMTGIQKFKMRSHEWGETTMPDFEALKLGFFHFGSSSYTLQTLFSNVVHIGNITKIYLSCCYNTIGMIKLKLPSAEIQIQSLEHRGTQGQNIYTNSTR